MPQEFYDLDFFGLKRRLPVTHLSPRLKIANFNLLGDVEFTQKAGEIFEKKLKSLEIKPDCFVGPEVKVVPLVHHLARRLHHPRYVILRKNISNYMIRPLTQTPRAKAPQHITKLVLNGGDAQYLKNKKAVIIDDVVSTGWTMKLAENLLRKAEVKVLARCAIFLQGERYQNNLIYLARLPVMKT